MRVVFSAATVALGTRRRRILDETMIVIASLAVAGLPPNSGDGTASASTSATAAAIAASAAAGDSITAWRARALSLGPGLVQPAIAGTRISVECEGYGTGLMLLCKV